jgi:hypothetical protein
MAFQTAGELATEIKMLAKMDVIDLGDDDDSQNLYIFAYMNQFLKLNAKLANKIVTTDALVVSGSGYVNFLVSTQAITNMYEPSLMIDPTDKAVARRTSFDATAAGWFREDAYSSIHMRGLSGTYRLKYIKYPDKITLAEQTPEYPPQGYAGMIAWIISRIKFSKNFYQEAQAMQSFADGLKYTAVKASTAARGNNQQLPSNFDADMGV